MSESVSNQVVMISADKLRPHPDNPRKNLGDLSELTESIKENGILQNLTVVPDPDKGKDEEGYLIVIGHRRNAAGIAAGLDEFPCVVRDLTHADQIKMMLCENIQRNDLTVMEQAQGFQMMIDFGITVEDLAKDTGFAQSTIYHRLNIAKLDPKMVEDTQLTITDLIELEKIEDIETRNRILAKSNKQTFRQTVDTEYRAQELEKIKTKLIKKLQGAGLEERKANSWSPEIGIKKDFYLTYKTDIDSIKPYKEDDDGNKIGDFNFYSISDYGSVLIYDLKSEEEQAAEAELSPKQKRRNEIDDEVGVLFVRLEAVVKEAVEAVESYKVAALEKVAKMNRKEYDAFLTDCLLIISLNIDELSYMNAFQEESYEVASLYDREDGYAGFYRDMKTALEKEMGGSPFSYIYEMLLELIRINGRSILSNKWSILNNLSRDITNKDGCFIFGQSLDKISQLGFQVDKELTEILEGTHKYFQRVEEFRKEYAEL